MKLLKSIQLIINYKTFIVTALAIIATAVCHHYNYVADLPLTLIGIAIVFPIVFAINSAYDRRELALQYLADFKSHSMAIVYAARDWGFGKKEELMTEIKDCLIDLYAALRKKLLTKKINTEFESERPVFNEFSRLSIKIQKFKTLDLSPGELARVNQYLSKLMINYENLKIIYYYRTPITLRAYSKVFLHIFPIIYAPYFAYIGQEFPIGLAYMLPIIFSFVLVSLDNIQVHLENPFDQIGEDDIRLDEDEFQKLLK